MRMSTVLCAVVALILSAGGAETVWSDDGFLENWKTSPSSYFSSVTPSGAQVLFNVQSTDASDSAVLQLLLPASPKAGPGGGPQVQTKARYLYGSFSTRLKTADSSVQLNAGVVTGFFTYFHGGDSNANGLPDNSEIDFEWLGAKPEVIYLTMWTDYRDADATFKRVS